MRFFIIHCVLAASVFMQASLVSGEPFNVRDYRQGMSLEQVQRFAEKHGHTLRHDKNNKINLTVQQNGTDILSLSFCNDRVFSAHYLVVGGFERFIKILDSLTKRGLRKTDVNWRSDIGYDGKEGFKLEVYFSPQKQQADYYVTATLFADEERGPTNSQITWTAVDGYCKW